MACRVHRRCSSSPYCGGGRPSAKGIDLARGRKIGDGVRSTLDELEVKSLQTEDSDGRWPTSIRLRQTGTWSRTFRRKCRDRHGSRTHSQAARFAGSFLGELLYETGDLAEATRRLDESYSARIRPWRSGLLGRHVCDRRADQGSPGGSRCSGRLSCRWREGRRSPAAASSCRPDQQ